MTDEHPTAEHSAAETDAVAHHDAVTHMDTHAVICDDDHGHADPRLGPIDWPAWGYALLGVLLGLLVAGLLWWRVFTAG